MREDAGGSPAKPSPRHPAYPNRRPFKHRCASLSDTASQFCSAIMCNCVHGYIPVRVVDYLSLLSKSIEAPCEGDSSIRGFVSQDAFRSGEDLRVAKTMIGSG